MRIGAEQSIGRCVAFPGAPTLRRDFSAACDALSPLFPIKPDSPSHHSASLVTPSPLRFVPVSGLGVCHLHGTSVPEKGRFDRLTEDSKQSKLRFFFLLSCKGASFMVFCLFLRPLLGLCFLLDPCGSPLLSSVLVFRSGSC